MDKLVVIAGPCVIESDEITTLLAGRLKGILHQFKDDVDFIFKASYDKANRTKYDSFRGPGIKDGMALLHLLKQTIGLKITSDIHSIEEIKQVGKILDIIQIPAFLCRQTDLLIAAVQTDKIINVKKGQFISPDDAQHIIRKLGHGNLDKIYITERGSSFGYKDIIVDFRSFKRMRRLFPHKIIFDASHSSTSREFIPGLAKAAIVNDADGIFVEVHPDPANAKCDGKTSLPLDYFEQFIEELLKLRKV